MTVYGWASFALFTLTWSVIPGPSIGFTIAYAIDRGLTGAVMSIAGQLSANVLQMLLVFAGLDRLVCESAQLFVVLKLAGAAYLVYLGVQQWRARGSASSNAGSNGPADGTKWRDFRKGFLVCAGNPKAILYFAALFPQFLSVESSRPLQFAALGATNLVIGAGVMLLYALLAERVCGWLATPRRARIRERISGGVMVAAAVYLAIGRRS